MSALALHFYLQDHNPSGLPYTVKVEITTNQLDWHMPYNVLEENGKCFCREKLVTSRTTNQ
jgi:hypothetical protein